MRVLARMGKGRQGEHQSTAFECDWSIESRSEHQSAFILSTMLIYTSKALEIYNLKGAILAIRELPLYGETRADGG